MGVTELAVTQTDFSKLFTQLSSGNNLILVDEIDAHHLPSGIFQGSQLVLTIKKKKQVCHSPNTV